jgi:hypothetical protein
MLGRKDDDLVMDLKVVKIMETIHMDYIDEVYIKCSFQTHDTIKILGSSNGSINWSFLTNEHAHFD